MLIYLGAKWKESKTQFYVIIGSSQEARISHKIDLNEPTKLKQITYMPSESILQNLTNIQNIFHMLQKPMNPSFPDKSHYWNWKVWGHRHRQHHHRRNHQEWNHHRKITYEVNIIVCIETCCRNNLGFGFLCLLSSHLLCLSKVFHQTHLRLSLQNDFWFSALILWMVCI